MSMKQEGTWPRDMGPAFRLGLTQAGNMVGQELVKRVKTGMLTGPKSGRIYARRGGTYQASAPGEYSAVVSGDLIGSINYRMQGIEYLAFYATSDHAGYQEDGTSKMAARENLKRAIRESDPVITGILDQVVWRAIRSS